MQWIFWCAAALLAAVILVLVIALICFFRVFFSPTRRTLGPDEYEIPKGEIYEPFREEMVGWVKMTRSMPHETVSVRSFDGLTLRGKYYECRPGAPMEIQFHGYQGNAERDLSGGVARCFALGRNILIVDQRGCGASDGHVITFGIRERLDCLKWVEYAVNRFGKDVRIVLTGISMGAATVVMASGEPLPENVVSVLSDCGYSSAREIIKKVIAEMGLPPTLVYPFVRLGARLFGRFDLEETAPIAAIRRCKVPVLFFHGDADAFVPPQMSQALYDACPSANKRLVIVPGAGHGLAFPVDKEGYLRAMRETAEAWHL